MKRLVWSCSGSRWPGRRSSLRHPPPGVLERYAEEGQKALAERRWADAARAYEKLRELSPETAEVHAQLGMIYFQQHDFARAVPTLRQALKLKPGLPNVDILLAMCLSELGQYKEALPGLQKGFGQSSDAALRRLAGLQLQRSYTGLGQDDKAVEVALQLTRLYKDDPEVLYHTGRLFSNYAYLMTMRLAEVAPDVGLDASGRGRGQREPGELRRRPRRVPEGARPRPGPARDPLPHGAGVPGAGAATPLGGRRRGAAPRGSSSRSFGSIPRTPTPPTSSGRSDARRETWTRRAELFELAVSSYPDFEQGLVGLGRVLVSQGKADLALPPLTKAVSLNPEDDVAYFQLWQAHRALGHREEQEKAQAEFQRLRARKREQERLDLLRQHVGHAAGARCADDAALGWARADDRGDERFHEEPEHVDDTTEIRIHTGAGALRRDSRCSWPVPSPQAFAAKRQTPLRVVGLRTEYKENPLGIDARKPRLSWRIESDGRGVVQSAYEIRVARSERGLQAKGERVWESGKVSSDESIQRPYDGPALRSGERYYWQVRVWDGSGKASAWSAPAWWEMGLLEPSDWKASWIEPDLPEDVTKSGPVPMLRREFKLSGVVARARAYVTSHGLYEMHLNGQRVGDHVFTPGWTSYNKRLQYQTYDVTALLKAGDNAVGVRARQRLVPGRPGVGGPAQRLRRSPRPSAADPGHLQGRARGGDRQRRPVESDDGPDPDVGDLPRRDLRRASREARLDGARLRRSGVVGGQGRRATARTISSPPPGRRCGGSRS